MKTLANKFFGTAVLISLLIVPVLHAHAGNGKGQNSSSPGSTARAAALTVNQAANYLASSGLSVTAVSPAPDGSGNFIATKADGHHVLVHVSGNSFNGIEDLPN